MDNITTGIFPKKHVRFANEARPAVIANRTGVNNTVSSMTVANGTVANDTVANGTIVNGNAANGTVATSILTTIWIGTAPALCKMLDALIGLPTEPPSIYVDLEGVNLSRYGTISILQIHVHLTNTTYLIDVQSLKGTCFSTAGENGQTLKHILESPLIPKVFFDVRSDADALFVLHGISLYGVLDLQLMEFATRPQHQKKFVNGLTKCVSLDSPLPFDEKIRWVAAKNQGRQQFVPDLGGSYEVLTERPLRRDIQEYCTQDVSVMPGLWAHYDSKITAEWKQMVVVASKERVWMSHAADYISVGPLMALAPLSLISPPSTTAYKYFYHSFYPYFRKCCFYYRGIATADDADAAYSTAISAITCTNDTIIVTSTNIPDTVDATDNAATGQK